MISNTRRQSSGPARALVTACALVLAGIPLAGQLGSRPVEEWVKRLDKVGLRDTGKRLLQPHDPTDNVLMSFVKQ